MKDTELAFISGVIEARGHIEVGKRGPRIRITTARTPLLTYLAKHTGVKVVHDDRGYQRRPCSDHCEQPHSHYVRQSTQWTVDSTRATIVLHNVMPYLIDTQPKAKKALATGMKNYPPARGDTITQMKKLGWETP